MGTDLFVSEQSEFRTDSKGRTQYTVTQLDNFRGRGCDKIIDSIPALSKMSNCSTVSVDAMDIINALNDLEADREYDYGCDRDTSELDDAIDKLTSFIEENDLKDLSYCDRTFEFHLWF